MSLQIGQRAPDFTLPACDGSHTAPFTLSEALGQKRFVLAFFPLAFSPVCTEELCEFRDGLKELESLDAEVLGISVDSPYALNAFIRAEGLNFKLLSDFNKEVSARYGVLYESLGDFKGVAKRSVFVLDPQGTVRYAWVSEDPRKRPDLEEVRDALSRLA